MAKKLPPLAALEQTRRTGVIHDAENQNHYRPNENATDPARLCEADASVADNAKRWKGTEDAATEAGNNTDRSDAGRESENHAAELVAKAAGSLEGG
jgi:hypothetical protein